jgi:hypothetical protein
VGHDRAALLVKSQPQLLLRDALAAVFTAAAGGEARALEVVSALVRWREAPGADPLLAELRSERGTALFEASGPLAPEYAPLQEYVRDRALRFAAACGWLRQEGALGDALAAARAAWDAGLFFEVHELLEPLWLRTDAGPRREALQGLIMAGAALHHLCGGNLAGARGLLRDGSRKLTAHPDALGEPWRLAGFAAELAALAGRIERGEVRAASDVDALPELAPRG